MYLSILHLSSNTNWSLEVPEKSAPVVSGLLKVWAESLNLDLSTLSFLTDRGGEFEEVSLLVKDHVKTASYHPEANGKVERRHKEVAMLCRLYDCEPPDVAEMWHVGSYGVFLFKLLPGPGELVLHYNQRMGAKTKDPWSGPYLVQ